MNKWLVLVTTVIVAAFLGFIAARTPAPLGVDAPADQFSAGRAMADVRIIAREPHPVGTAANAAARDHVAERLRALGFSVRLVSVPLPARAARGLRKWGGDPRALATSIVALRAGRDPAAPAVAVMAHHDSVWGSPGAADDASGVASALEIARAIPRDSQARDLVLLITDGEELGLVGARAFFADGIKGDPLAGRIGAVVDLESRGGGGRAMMFETGPGNGAMIDLFQRSVRDPAANSLAVKIYELLPNSTDFTPAKKRGLPGFNFAFIGDPQFYHSPKATPDALDQGSLQHIGGQALDVTRALVTGPALPAVAPDVVFSDVFGLFVIAYPAWVGWVVVAAIAGLMFYAAQKRRADWRWGQVAAAMLDGIVFVAAAGVLLYGGNLLSGADGPTSYYDRLAAIPRLEVQALLLFAAGGALALALVPLRRGRFDGWLGLGLLNLLVVLAVQLLLPAAGPVLAWPLLLAALAMAVAAATGAVTLPPALAAVLGLAFVGGFAHFVLLGVGPTMPSAVAVLAPLVALLSWPLLPRPPRRTLLLAALALVIGGAVIALWVRLDPTAATVPPYDARG